jgi:hypothetical protein
LTFRAVNELLDFVSAGPDNRDDTLSWLRCWLSDDKMARVGGAFKLATLEPIVQDYARFLEAGNSAAAAEKLRQALKDAAASQ